MTRLSSLEERPSTWLQAWLLLLPVLPFLSVVAISGLRSLNQLAPMVQVVLAVYAASQLIAACFAPEPLLALGTALLRTLLLFGLIGLGVRLKRGAALQPLLIGLLVVFSLALITSFGFSGSRILSFRLSHPYYTPISLGLAGAVALWIAVSACKSRRWWRLISGGLAIAVLLLSGSRGPLLVAAIGSLMALASSSRRLLIGLTITLVLGLTTALLGGSQQNVFSRIASLDATGRDVVWSDTLSVIAAHPIGGMGSYLLGGIIAPTEQQCAWFTALEERGFGCPAVLEALNGAWIIAHNGFLQQAGETGLIGTAGLFLLLGWILHSALIAKDPLVLAVVSGLLIANLTDNVTLLPSPFFAELFWLASGMALATQSETGHRGALMAGVALLSVTSFPVYVSATQSTDANTYIMRSLVAPTHWAADEPYLAWVSLAVPTGAYRLQLRACSTTCRTMSVLPVTAENGTIEQAIGGFLPSRVQRLELRLLDAKTTPWQLRPLARATWALSMDIP